MIIPFVCLFQVMRLNIVGLFRDCETIYCELEQLPKYSNARVDWAARIQIIFAVVLICMHGRFYHANKNKIEGLPKKQQLPTN
jgi:hypothetical protein